MTAMITGIDSYTPKDVLDNEAFEVMVDTTDEWIRDRTGIQERRISKPNKFSTDMMVPPSQEALRVAGLRLDQIDLLIATTSFPDRLVELPSDILADKLGLPYDTPALDVNAECAGFCWALAQAKELMALYPYKYRRVLVASGDTTTKHVDYNDRGSCILFGDAGGAVVLEQGLETGIFGAYRRSDRRYQDCLRTDRDGLMHFGPRGGGPMLEAIVRLTPPMIEEFCEEFDLSVSRVKKVIPHQVNKRITDALRKAFAKMGFAPDALYDKNIARFGNCSGSSVPLALDTCWREGELSYGDLVLLVAWGAGLKIGMVGLYWTMPNFKEMPLAA
jgi:3-oxoacyl-[acyl-carrier-protein] synthase-3